MENQQFKSSLITNMCLIDFESLSVLVNGNVVAKIKCGKLYRML